MFIPLVDILRCPHPHDETWLVASIERADNRYIVDGMLGCPNCFAEFPIRGGVVYFSEDVRRPRDVPPDEAQATRLAAVLDLTEPRMSALLHGEWAAQAQLVRSMSPSQLILLNPPEGMTSGDGVSVIVSNVCPFAQQSLDAIAFDPSLSEPTLAALQPSLRRGRRLLAASSVPTPAGFTELARDKDVWVAQLTEAAVTSAPIPLQRRLP
jgi:uncharacterized protein YbaR (Trm112 family)